MFALPTSFICFYIINARRACARGVITVLTLCVCVRVFPGESVRVVSRIVRKSDKIARDYAARGRAR